MEQTVPKYYKKKNLRIKSCGTAKEFPPFIAELHAIYFFIYFGDKYWFVVAFDRRDNSKETSS